MPLDRASVTRASRIMLPEEWRPIPGYEGAFEVSSHGNVRSVPRVVLASNGQLREYKGRQRAVVPNKRTGYLQVSLQIAGRRQKSLSVHTLVAAAFLGPRPPGLVVCHANGDSTDNRVENLRYDTQSANHDDAVAHGTQWPARLTHCKNGHEFTPENTGVRLNPNGRPGRRCLACVRINNGRAAKRKASHAA